MTVVGPNMVDVVDPFEFHITNQEPYHEEYNYEPVNDPKIKELLDELKATGLTIEAIMREMQYETWTGRIKCVGYCKGKNKPFKAVTNYGIIRMDHVRRHITQSHRPKEDQSIPNIINEDDCDYELVIDQKIQKLVDVHKNSGYTIVEIRKEMKDGIWTGLIKCVGVCKQNNKPFFAEIKSKNTIKTSNVSTHIIANHMPKDNRLPSYDKVVEPNIETEILEHHLVDGDGVEVLVHCNGSPKMESKLEPDENLPHSSSSPPRSPPKTEPECDLLMDDESRSEESATKIETISNICYGGMSRGCAQMPKEKCELLPSESEENDDLDENLLMDYTISQDEPTSSKRLPVLLEVKTIQATKPFGTKFILQIEDAVYHYKVSYGRTRVEFITLICDDKLKTNCPAQVKLKVRNPKIISSEVRQVKRKQKHFVSIREVVYYTFQHGIPENQMLENYEVVWCNFLPHTCYKTGVPVKMEENRKSNIPQFRKCVPILPRKFPGDTLPDTRRKAHFKRHITKCHQPNHTGIDEDGQMLKQLLDEMKKTGHTIEEIHKEMKNDIWTGFMKCVGACKGNNRPFTAINHIARTIQRHRVRRHIVMCHRPKGQRPSTIVTTYEI